MKTALTPTFLLPLLLTSATFAQTTFTAATPPTPVETKAIDFLLSKQADNGSWLAPAGPGPTALILKGLLQAGHTPAEPAVAKALAFIASTRQSDGGYYTNSNATYNTAIVLAALARLPEPDRAKLASDIKGTQDFLKSIQSGQSAAATDDKGQPVNKDHPWFGGWGYGQGTLPHGRRPDLSNTHFVIEALRDSGVPASDPAIKNALTFLTRLQASEDNPLPWAKGRDGGGFIYSMGFNTKHNFYGESEGPDTTDRDGNDILTTYGSMTYAGLKSLLYADLSHDDPRVKAALKWISNNYTLEQNPGLNTQQGLFYYYNAMASALHAYGQPTITDAKGVAHDWRRELADTLTHKQKPDGSFVNTQDRWMESDPSLCTSYVVLALQNARAK
ncbi:MAG TPA: prenyltransferase/squalene oxidase repeat-containing protein [Phycisphaerae bacterium]|nr:prenyltransferase/squalene oxidase repeat-containing protein [Phycisphaerae bacterium]